MTRAEVKKLKAASARDHNGQSAIEHFARKLNEACANIEEPSKSLISQFGQPAFRYEKGTIKKLNELFWARFYASERIAIYEPNEGQFYEYDPGTGLYVPQTPDLVRKQLAAQIEKADREWPDWRGIGQFCAESNLRGIIAHIRGELERTEPFKTANRIVHLANCVVQFREDGSFTVEQFSPEFLSRNRSPVSYDPSARSPKFIDMMLGHLEKDDRELLQKYAGQCLLGRNLTQQILLLDGVGGSSKSTTILALRGIVGAVNTMELRTKHLEDRFEIGRMLGKTLLLGSDAKSDFLSGPGASRLKAIVGETFLTPSLRAQISGFP
jgi:putative DNA primase/helicase